MLDFTALTADRTMVIDEGDGKNAEISCKLVYGPNNTDTSKLVVGDNSDAIEIYWILGLLVYIQ